MQKRLSARAKKQRESSERRRGRRCDGPCVSPKLNHVVLRVCVVAVATNFVIRTHHEIVALEIAWLKDALSRATGNLNHHHKIIA